jgi:hypothetical protein
VADRLAGLVLLGAQRLERGDRLTAALVEGEQLIEDLGPAPARQRGANRLRLGADVLEVEDRGS